MNQNGQPEQPTVTLTIKLFASGTSETKLEVSDPMQQLAMGDLARLNLALDVAKAKGINTVLQTEMQEIMQKQRGKKGLFMPDGTVAPPGL